MSFQLILEAFSFLDSKSILSIYDINYCSMDVATNETYDP